MTDYRAKMQRQIKCQTRDEGYALSFVAMASPCELLVETQDRQLALILGRVVADEAWRIEDKYSRYLPTSVCSQLNTDAGKQCRIDQETYQLLQFADQCYQLSDGLFDITSGVLRKAWQFDGSDNLPSQQQISQLLPLVGWQRIIFDRQWLQMAPGMEIDFGGMAKEYAVDRAMAIALQIVTQKSPQPVPLLVNFGGDLVVNGPRKDNQPWHIGVEHPARAEHSAMMVCIHQGALATSGDAKRFLQKDGQRYSHVLNVKTGWPVVNPPKSVTVAAPKCSQAGLLATLALLQGEQASEFLTQQEIQHWLIG